MTTSPQGPRVLFVQYANPAAYPPIEHAVMMLAGRGASVHVIGLALLDQVRMPPHPRVTVELLPAPAGGWRLRFAFLRFIWRVCVGTIRFRPTWIYASDALSTPAAWLAGRLRRSHGVYHEHDAPERLPSGPIGWVVSSCRRQVARGADLCVAPSGGRAEAIRESTGRSDVHVAWNTPALAEVGPARSGTALGTRLLFHGSIVPARVPETLLHALARLSSSVTLCITGYDPSGGAYVGRLTSLARELGIADRVEFRGTVTDRAEIMRQCRAFDVGVALLPLQSSSLNERTMLGASNKVFDYLASGLAVLVPDLPDWRAAFVEPGYGMACDPASVESLRLAIDRLDADPGRRMAMGERGRQRVLTEWHYERAFRRVSDRMLSGEP